MVEGLPYLQLPPSFGDHPWEAREPEEHQGVLSVGLTVQCEETRMVVSIAKEILQVSEQQTFISRGPKNILFELFNSLIITLKLAYHYKGGYVCICVCLLLC